MGLVNSPVPCGQVLDAALRLAYELAAFPQRCVRSDRLSAYEQWSLLTRRRSATSSAVASTSPNRARPTLVGTPSLRARGVTARSDAGTPRENAHLSPRRHRDLDLKLQNGRAATLRLPQEFACFHLALYLAEALEPQATVGQDVGRAESHHEGGALSALVPHPFSPLRSAR
jgi:hypothetical protein